MFELVTMLHVNKAKQLEIKYSHISEKNIVLVCFSKSYHIFFIIIKDIISATLQLILYNTQLIKNITVLCVMVGNKFLPSRRPGAHLFRSPRRRQGRRLSEKYLNFSSYFFRSDTDSRYGKNSRLSAIQIADTIYRNITN